MKQHGKARDHNEPEIIKAFENLGCLVVFLHPPAPDLLVGIKGAWHLVEVKSAKGVLTEPQLRLMQRTEGTTLPFHVVRTVAEAIALVRP